MESSCSSSLELMVGGQQSGPAGCKPPPLFTRGASSCSSQGRRQGEPWGASPRPSAPTYLLLLELMVSSLLEFDSTWRACSETEGKNGEDGAEMRR